MVDSELIDKAKAALARRGIDAASLTAEAQSGIIDPAHPDYDFYAEQQRWEDWIADGCPPVDGKEISDRDKKLLLAAPLTVRQAARRENVSERSVYRWLTSGELDAHRVGSEWRITTDALDRRRIESKKPKPVKKPTKKRASRKKAAPAASDMDWWTP